MFSNASHRRLNAMLKNQEFFAFRNLSVCLLLVSSVLYHPAPSGAQQSSQERGLGLSNSVKALPAAAKRYALVIGVDQYADTQISTLGGSANDARALRDALVRYAGFPADQVILLATQQPAERLPTRGNILRRLSNLAAIVPKDGLLLIAFAGHGLERNNQAFLLPSDAQVSDDINLLEQTAVNVVSVRDWVRKTGVAQVLMIVDACRNDPAGRANADNPLTRSYTKGFNFDVRNREVTAFATLYATQIGHRAYEYKEKRHGYFTWALVEGLKGGAANERGEVTLGGLINYLQERVPKQVLIDLGPGKKQTPWAVIEGYRAADLVLAAPGTASSSSTRPAAPATEVGANDGENTAEPKAEPTADNLEGTTWRGSTKYGEFEIAFMKGGKLQYTLLSNKKPIGGTWKKIGTFVHMQVGFGSWQGTYENGLMKGQAAGLDDEKYDFFMSPEGK